MSSMIWKSARRAALVEPDTRRFIRQMSSLLHLCQPIVGTAAIGLYLTLAYQIRCTGRCPGSFPPI